MPKNPMKQKKIAWFCPLNHANIFVSLHFQVFSYKKWTLLKAVKSSWKPHRDSRAFKVKNSSLFVLIFFSFSSVFWVISSINTKGHLKTDLFTFCLFSCFDKNELHNFKWQNNSLIHKEYLIFTELSASLRD